MKFFTKNKIIAGVIGLIALVSVVNTQAIIKLTNYIKAGSGNEFAVVAEGQSAQVFSSRSNCVRILPASNNHTTFVDPANVEGLDGLSKHMFVIGFKIKNLCNQSISVVKEGFNFPNGANAFQNSKLEDFPNINNQTASTNYSFSGPNPSFISDIYGISALSSAIPNGNINGVTLTGDGEMKVTNIPAGGEKEFIVFSYVDANADGIIHNTRLSLKNIRWFLTQSYQDNLLSSNEVKTYALTAPEVEKYTTSYARFKSQGSDDCAEGAIIGYNKDGTPIFCK
jgi:hypothetical protein